MALFKALSEWLAARLAGSQLSRSVSTLVGGTAFAQVVSLVALPFLTRLYDPSDFSILAIYASILGILCVVACMRLEIAIPLPESDEVAAALLFLALGSGLAMSLAIGVVALTRAPQLSSILGIPEFLEYFWLLPIGVWAGSWYAALQYWATRRKNFIRIARTRMIQSLGGAGIQVGSGLQSGSPFGLLSGHIFSSGAGVVGLGRAAWKEDSRILKGVSWRSMREALRSYSRFPKYSTTEALLNTAGLHAPIVIIAALAVGAEAGYLMLATKVVTAPMGLIGGSVAQVYLANAPEQRRAGELRAFTLKILVGLWKLGVGPLLLVGVIAVPAFVLVFGQEWGRAGELVTWMTPWFVLQFLSSPVSMVMHVTGKQRSMLMLTLIGGASRIAAVFAAGLFYNEYMSEVFAVASALVYLIYLIAFSRAAGVSLADLRGLARARLSGMGLWLLGGAFLFVLLRFGESMRSYL